MTEASIPPVPAPAVSALAHGELAGLNGLRALSVLAVMVAHFGFGRIVPGGLGVTIFFFISGFLITTLMLREVRATGGIAIGRFYLRRFLRLQPELATFILISVLLTASFPEPIRLLDVLGALFYFSNYIYVGVIGGGELGHLRWPQLWSLAIEEHYYLTYPMVFALFIAAPKRLMGVIGAVLVGALLLRFVYQAMGVPEEHIYAATETRIDSIAYGCFTALACWFLPDNVKAAATRHGLLIGLVAAGLLVGSLLIRSEFFRDTLRYSMQGMSISCLFVFLFLCRQGEIVAGWLDWAPLKWMGRMSYGAYLWHLEVGGMVEQWTGLPFPHTVSLQSAASCVLLSALTFAVAWISFSLLQKPLLALRHRLSAHT